MHIFIDIYIYYNLKAYMYVAGMRIIVYIFIDIVFFHKI